MHFGVGNQGIYHERRGEMFGDRFLDLCDCMFDETDRDRRVLCDARLVAGDLHSASPPPADWAMRSVKMSLHPLVVPKVRLKWRRQRNIHTIGKAGACIATGLSDNLEPSLTYPAVDDLIHRAPRAAAGPPDVLASSPHGQHGLRWRRRIVGSGEGANYMGSSVARSGILPDF